uniref:Trans-1,2-dihydrobenzene-1,2-diol dehydrogenase n=1 Tax=Heliothis virescens TaxID=7102 RepID=A0A2A4J2T5_HELVI
MTLRWGIVSAGKISHDFVNGFNTYPDKGDQAIIGVAARDKSRAAEFAKLHKIPKVFDNYQALANSSDIDVVYIGALNPDHYSITKLFLENGKHVLCEKPFCLNLKQTESLFNLAKKKNLFLMEAVWTRFSPAYIYLEKEIAAGSLGDVTFLEGDFGIVCESDRMFKKDQGGSALLDIGIYLLQLSQYVFKKYPEKITAIGELNQEGVDVTETIVLEYGDGKRAVLNTQSRLRLINRATIYGSKGRITLEDPFHFPDRVTAPNGELKKFPLHTSEIPYNFENSAGLVYQALEVARCIRSGLTESPRMSHKESIELVKIRDAIRKQLGVHYDADDQEFP